MSVRSEALPRNRRERRYERQGNRLNDRLQELHNPHGINTKRAEHFIRALGIPMTRYAIVDVADEKKVVRAFRGVRGESAPRSQSYDGQHFVELDAAVVYRHPGGAAKAEHTLVHELGHGRQSARSRTLGETMRSYLPFAPPAPYSGFISGRRGWFNEETFAYMVQAGYRQSMHGQQGLHPDSLIPARYDQTCYGHFAGLALEALCTRTPELLDIILTSRRDSNAMQQVAEAYNDIKPGLFDAMQMVAPGMVYAAAANFQYGFNMALDAAGYTVDDIPKIHDQGVVVSYVQDRLQSYEARTGYVFVPDTPGCTSAS